MRARVWHRFNAVVEVDDLEAVNIRWTTRRDGTVTVRGYDANGQLDWANIYAHWDKIYLESLICEDL